MTGPRARLFALLLFAIGLGYFEAAVVVDLRELYYPNGFHFPIPVATPADPASWRIALVEVGREVASLLILATVAFLAGRRFLERFAAFLVAFGTWDLVYYLVLRLALGWPESLASPDVLFLLPAPWVGPVWAPMAVAVALVAAGGRLYLTADRERRLGALDWTIEIAAGATVVAACLRGGAVVGGRLELRPFPVSLFAAGLGLGVAWFVVVELREARRRSR